MDSQEFVFGETYQVPAYGEKVLVRVTFCDALAAGTHTAAIRTRSGWPWVSDRSPLADESSPLWPTEATDARSVVFGPYVPKTEFRISSTGDQSGKRATVDFIGSRS